MQLLAKRYGGQGGEQQQPVDRHRDNLSAGIKVEQNYYLTASLLAPVLLP